MSDERNAALTVIELCPDDASRMLDILGLTSLTPRRPGRPTGVRTAPGTHTGKPCPDCGRLIGVEVKSGGHGYCPRDYSRHLRAGDFT